MAAVMLIFFTRLELGWLAVLTGGTTLFGRRLPDLVLAGNLMEIGTNAFTGPLVSRKAWLALFK